MSTLKQAMRRLADAGIEPMPAAKNEQERDERTAQIATLNRVFPGLDWERFDDELIEQLYEQYLLKLGSSKRDLFGRLNMYYYRTARCPEVAKRKPSPGLVCEQHPKIVRDNELVLALNQRLMSEQDYAAAMRGDDGAALLHPLPYPDAWEGARKRALRLELSARAEAIDSHRRWLLDLSEGRIPLPSDNSLEVVLKEAAREVLE
tara:strand:+ start:483 stop:1097 length:615 start_codon:yes stop_codon:yes gene_type:complete